MKYKKNSMQMCYLGILVWMRRGQGRAVRGGRAGHERTVIPCHHSPSRRGEEGIEGGKGEGRSREMKEREGRRQDRTGQG